MLNNVKDRRILVGVCGGIAAYKTVYLVRELIKMGAIVKVVMTESAKAFVTPQTFQALTGFPVGATVWQEFDDKGMGHIALAKWADDVIIAPLSANTLAKMAMGLADDLLTTIYLATRARVFVCPSMNQAMWSHQATEANIATLQSRGIFVVPPFEGEQACGDEGFGRMAEPHFIIEALQLAVPVPQLKGKRVIVTAGGTKSYLDPVRYLTNQSSGKLGIAIANACFWQGAEVILVSAVHHPLVFPGVIVYEADTPDAMYETVMNQLKQHDWFVGVAAVSDYQFDSFSAHKIKKSADTMTFTLTKTNDILAAVATKKICDKVIGFAAETTHVIDYARQKLAQKDIDAIFANEVGCNKGFGDANHEGTLILKDNAMIKFEKQTKVALAKAIVLALL